MRLEWHRMCTFCDVTNVQDYSNNTLSRAVVLIVGLGFLSTYSGYVIGQFRQRYPFIHSMADAGNILLGPIGRNVLEFAQLVFFVFATGSHLLTFTVMMNTLTNHGTCSIVFGVVGLVLSFILSLPRTMKNVSWLAMACKLARLSINKARLWC